MRVRQPPKKLATCADRLYEIKLRSAELRQELAQDKRTKELERLKKEVALIETKIREELPKDGAQGIAGKLAMVQLVDKDRPTVEDRDKLNEYIKKTGSFDLLQKKLNNKAVEERWKEGKIIPGIGVFTDRTVSLRKK